jgi:hypothetical protein
MPEQDGLPAPGLSDDCENFTLVHVKVDIVKDDLPAEPLPEMFYLQ